MSVEPMVLNALTTYPHSRSFVLKLHAEAAPAEGRLIGRLEHVTSGRQFIFHSVEELIHCLAQCEQPETGNTGAAP